MLAVYCFASFAKLLYCTDKVFGRYSFARARNRSLWAQDGYLLFVMRQQNINHRLPFAKIAEVLEAGC